MDKLPTLLLFLAVFLSVSGFLMGAITAWCMIRDIHRHLGLDDERESEETKPPLDKQGL